MKALSMLFAACLLCLALACSRDDLRPTEARLTGEWNFLYEYLADGTPTDSFTTSVNTTHPYAMLGFDYSSGFVLHADGSFQISWFSQVKENFDGHRWTFEGDTLLLTPREDGPSYRYLISNLSQEALDFENLDKGAKWRLMRVSD